MADSVADNNKSNNTLNNRGKDMNHVTNNGIDADMNEHPPALAPDAPQHQPRPSSQPKPPSQTKTQTQTAADPSSSRNASSDVQADPDPDDNPAGRFDDDAVLELAYELVLQLADDGYGPIYELGVAAVRERVGVMVFDMLLEVAARVAEHAGREVAEWNDVLFAAGMLQLLGWPGEYETCCV